MWNLLMQQLKICFIGNGSHAKRIQEVLSCLSVNYRVVDFERAARLSGQIDVINCHVIFITSPNDTHAQYLSELSEHFNGYIYCEKPPINRLEDLKIFDAVDFERCFFGFNLRYSGIHGFLSDVKKQFPLGRLLNTHIHRSYPFAIKPEYQDSWKSDKTRSPHGVLENLGVHYVDLSMMFSGNIKDIRKRKINLLGSGSAVDTATIFCEHENGSTSHIFVSYATSFREEMYLTFEKGDISYDGDVSQVYYPRDSFDSRGLSIRPPVVLAKTLNSEALYDESMRNCIKEFVEVVLNKGGFNPDLALRSRSAVLAILN
jgi:predicted dehydrogenase